MGIPSDYPLSAVTQSAYQELAAWLVERHRSGLRVLGINGAQGSGKGTLAAFLVDHLVASYGLFAEAVSIDDFYLSRSSRNHLASTAHPLLATRGVPGTHDARYGLQCLKQLPALTPGQEFRLPRFSKAADDVLNHEHDRVVTHPPDIILFEGWCVGTPPQEECELPAPINELERVEDPDGLWRRHVNRRLSGDYATWFSQIDALVHLHVPAWEQVKIWRAQQEQETAAQNQGASAFLDDTARERFMQHYQRLTQHAQRVLPDTADVVLSLDMQHDVSNSRYQKT